MAKQGRIYYTDKDFSDAEVQSEFGFPVMLVLSADNKIVKITTYDELGVKSVALLDSSGGNRIVSLGTISNDANNIYLAVDSSGSNSVVINQNLYSKTTPDQFAYTTPSTGNVKVALIYALETTQIFYIIFGDEGETAIEPVLPDGALLIRRIIITDAGANIDPSVLDGFVEKAEETWKEIYTGSALSFVIDYSKRSRFKIKTSIDVPKTLTSIVFSAETQRAVEFDIYNDTNLNISIPNSTTSGLNKGFTTSNSPFIILPKTFSKIKYNPQTDIIECFKVNANVGSVFPVTGNNGDILEKDNTIPSGVKWSSKLSNYYLITTNNITAPDATYKYAIITDSSGITRRLDLVAYLNANYATSASISGKLDKASVYEQTVSSAVNFTGTIKLNPSVGGAIGSVLTFNETSKVVEKASTVSLDAVWSSSTAPTLAQLDSNYPDALLVYCPNLATKRVYHRCGAFWAYNDLVTVV